VADLQLVGLLLSADVMLGVWFTVTNKNCGGEGQLPAREVDTTL
jgi:hypothetical protein